MARIAFYETGYTANRRDGLPFVLPDFPVTQPVYATPQQGFDFVWRWSSMALIYNVDIDDGGGTITNSSGTIGSANSPVPIVDERDIGCHGFLIQQWTATTGSETILGTLILNSYDAGTNRFIFILDLQITNASGTIQTTPTATNGPDISIFGQLIPTYVSPGSTASGTIEVGVFAYYPYRNSLGNNPIWDVSTGAQLIIPLPTDAG